MKVLLAAPRGFCAGVNMAIESLELAIEAFEPPVYVYHEIVHNKYVVETFRDRGAVFVDELEEVPHGATLLFSAHGVSPAIREAARNRDLRTIDATCPLVTKVHAEAIRYANKGYQILRDELKNVGVSSYGANAQAMFDVVTPELDWVALARGHGMPAHRAEDTEGFIAALKAGFDTPGPRLIELVCP